MGAIIRIKWLTIEIKRVRKYRNRSVVALHKYYKRLNILERERELLLAGELLPETFSWKICKKRRLSEVESEMRRIERDVERSTKALRRNTTKIKHLEALRHSLRQPLLPVLGD